MLPISQEGQTNKEVHTGLNKAIQAAAVLAILAASTGQLPKIVRAVQIAQLHLLKQSQSSSWGRALLLPPAK